MCFLEYSPLSLNHSYPGLSYAENHVPINFVRTAQISR